LVFNITIFCQFFQDKKRTEKWTATSVKK